MAVARLSLIHGLGCGVEPISHPFRIQGQKWIGQFSMNPPSPFRASRRNPKANRPIQRVEATPSRHVTGTVIDSQQFCLLGCVAAYGAR